MTFLLDASVSRYRPPLKIRLCMRNKILKSGTLNNVKSNILSMKLIKKTYMFHRGSVSACRLLFFFFFCFIT